MIDQTLALSLLGAYLLGGINAGYYLVWFMKHQDLRTLGSSTVGAVNAGRVLGTAGFVTVFAADSLKGALVVFLAGQAGVAPQWLPWVLGCAVVGHIFPIQLGLRGGKGICTLAGGILPYDIGFFSVNLALYLILYATTRNRLLAGAPVFASMPFTAWLWGKSPMEISGLLVVTSLVLWVHRENFRRRGREITTDREGKGL